MLIADGPSLAATVAAVRAGRATARRLVEQALERVAATEPAVRAWVHVDDVGALAQARRLDDGPVRRPLHGVPVGVKDIVDVAGLPTGCGTPLRAGRVAAADAWVVARLRAAGAVVLGKTVTTEFAYFEPGPTRNPHEPARTPGGSSSGSAAAVAARVVPLAVGTQTAGSTIRPASFCGIAGHATAVGALPYAGIFRMCPSLDTIGLFTATVHDLAIVHAALHDVPVPAVPPAAPRLLVVGPGVFDGVEAEPATLFEAAVSALAAAGAGVRSGTLDPRLGEDHALVMAHEAAWAMRDEPRDALSPVLVELLDRGAAVDRAARDGALARAAARRRELLAALADADAVLAPASLGPAPRGLAATGDPACNRPFQLLGLPAVAVPGLRTAAGLPVGLALVGRPDAEDRLLSVARWVAARLAG